MNTTRINVVDAQPGQRVLMDYPSGDTATITKVKRPKGADFLRVTLVDDLGSVFTRRYVDGNDGSPTNWTLDIVT